MISETVLSVGNGYVSTAEKEKPTGQI